MWKLMFNFDFGVLNQLTTGLVGHRRPGLAGQWGHGAGLVIVVDVGPGRRSAAFLLLARRPESLPRRL